MNLFDLKGKNAVVVGAGGLGFAIIKGLADAGAQVMMADLSEETLAKSSAAVKEELGVDTFTCKVNACDEDSVKNLLNTAVEKMGKITILVNALGFNKKMEADEFDMAVFRNMLEVNVTAVMMTCKHFGKHMKENGYGKIVNISSVRGKVATITSGNAGYCSSKGAVNMMTLQLASEFGPFGITVNAIAPTVTETPMMTTLIETRGGDAYRKQLADALPMRRMAKPEDCVGTAIFLSSNASDFVTGNVVYPDGGLTAIG